MIAVTCKHYGQRQLGEVKDLLVSVYAEVYADRLGEEFFTVDRFTDRMAGHTAAANWEAVVGYDGDEPTGYAYGATRAREPDTFFLFELMMRAPWRKTGTARLIHDELIRGRPESQVMLCVEHEHPRVRALYESWGYQNTGQQHPFPDAPIFDEMRRPRSVR
jgi:hypothetical protein